VTGSNYQYEEYMRLFLVLTLLSLNFLLLLMPLRKGASAFTSDS
jgi:hypothetical protein